MTNTKVIIVFLFLIFGSVVSDARVVKRTRRTKYSSKDSVYKLLSCDSTSCLVFKSVFFFPIFPWFQCPMDREPTRTQYRMFRRVSGVLDFMLAKGNNSYSGYKFGGAFFRKWFGLDFDYDTSNNGEIDQKFFSNHFVFRMMPMRHIQPRLSVGWKYIITDTVSGGGIHFSFFDYKITFSRRFHMYVTNYIGRVKGFTIVEGLFGFEYYVYPTIAFKSYIEIKHVFSELLYGFKFGLSLKM